MSDTPRTDELRDAAAYFGGLPNRYVHGESPAICTLLNQSADRIDQLERELAEVKAERDELLHERSIERMAYEALKAEPDAYREKWDKECKAHDATTMRAMVAERELASCLSLENHNAIVRQLQAERDALKADAERYRWLRTHRAVSIQGTTQLDIFGRGVSPHVVDNLIDAAMKEAK